MSRPNSSLRIIVENDLDCDSDGNRFTNRVKSDAIEVRKMPESISPVDLVVVDTNSYRIESDRDTRAAVVVFGNEKIGAKASRLFESLWTDSKVCHSTA